jgi:fatty-acyl-CoA synthase
MYGCERAGAIYTPLNWRLSAIELAGLVADCRPALAVFETEFSAAAEVAFADRPDLRTFAIAPDHNPFRQALLARDPAPAQPEGPDAPCIILYTSGTTGRPKGVVLSRAQAFWGVFNFAAVGDVGPDSVMLCDTPMFHTVGLIATCRCILYRGGVCVLSDRFLPATTLARLADPDLGVTHYFGVPQIARMLADDDAYTGAELGRLKGFISGGAPLPDALRDRFLDDGVMVLNGYGMTESSTIAGMPFDPQAARAKPGSVGLTAPAMDLRIVDPEGRDADVDGIGEIWIRGPAIFSGYWEQPEATRAVFQDGWFKTGDAGRRDDDGFLFIVDRWKDMYISGGENVYPAEVESAIALLPGVREVGVVGVPHPRWGEVGWAFVVCHPQAGLSEAEVLAHCATRLARYKQPVEIRFVAELPRTASGKVRKDELRRRTAPV